MSLGSNAGPSGELGLFARIVRRCGVPAAVFAITLGIFFVEPLVHLRTGVYTFSDYLQQFALFKIEPRRKATNRLMGDPSVEIVPWLMLDRESVRRGHLPLWNPYNGGGVPLLAKYTSAPFSPFTIPFYVFPIRFALLLSAFLKLFCLGLFTYLFLREIALARAPALVGATAFQFSGMNILWLFAPQAGGIVALPAGFFFVERFLRAKLAAAPPESGHRPESSLIGLTASLLTALLAGHPETFYYSLLAVASYAAVRLWQFRAVPERRTLRGPIAAAAGQLCLAAILAAGLASAQLLPFLEYLVHSSEFNERQGVPDHGIRFRPSLAPLAVFPNLLGSPVLRRDVIDGLPDANFAEAVTPYVGASALFLGLGSIAIAGARRPVKFFAGLALVWILYAFSVPGFRALFRLIPGLGLAPPSRSPQIWAFSIACLAAIFLDSAARRDPTTNRRFAVNLAVAAAAFVAIAGLGAWMSLKILSADAESAVRLPRSFTISQTAPLLVSFVGAILGLVTIVLSANSSVRRLGMATILWAVFLQTGGLLRNFNPTVPDRYFYPATPALAELQRTVGRSRLVALGSDSIISDSNIPYRLSIPNSYDGQWIRDYDRLYRRLFDAENLQRTPNSATAKGLRLFGIEYVLHHGPGALNREFDAPGDLEPAARLKSFELSRYRPGLGSFYTVGNSAVKAQPEEALSAVLDPTFDPYASVVLQGGRSMKSTDPDEPARAAEIAFEDATRVELRVARRAAGYLVLTKPYYPGWKARVNGRRERVLEADAAFCAVEIPSGMSTVEFYYDPLSWKLGLLLTGFSALACALFFVRIAKPE